jgi:hypothetical protein
MKKLKEYVFIISITYMIFILVLIVLLFIYRRPYVTLVTPERVNGDFNNLQVKIDKLKDSECKTELNNLLKYYKDNSFNGKVILNKLYDFVNGLDTVKVASSINDKCGFSIELNEKYGIGNKYMSMMVIQDKLITTYLYQYELGFIDEASIDFDNGMSKYSYNILKYNEVELVEDYLNMLEVK